MCLLGAVLLGGLKRLSRVTETLVPFMALFYMGGAVVVLWMHRANLPQAFAQICSMAFDTRAGTGGVLGYGMTQAVRAGVSRGIFSNEAGLGSSVMVHAAADAREPCEQGMWAVFEVFFDTIVMCSVTAFVILTSGVYDVSRYALASGTPLLSQLTTGAQLTAVAFSTVFGRFGGGFVSGSFGIPSGIVGAVTAVLLGAVLLGGLKRLSRATETLVPFMALFYMGGAVVVLWVHRANLPQAFAQICSMAFDTRAGTGGVLGYGMMQAVRAGVSRGVFSNEAGLGSSVMVHTAADAKEPCEQGMWAVFEVFFDTIVMCSVTAFVILTSGVYDVSRYALASGTPLLSQLTTGAQLTAEAFSTVFGRFGGGFVAVSLALFAFSTLLGWSYYGQRAAAYLMGERVIPVYKAAFLLAAVAGCMMRLEPVWALSDTFNGLMALPNLAGVLALRRQVIAEWCRYKHDL